MENEVKENSQCEHCCHGKGCKKWRHRGGGTAGGAYCVGFIGALVFYIQHAPTFWLGVLGVLKAIVWPAMIVYKLLEFLKM